MADKITFPIVLGGLIAGGAGLGALVAVAMRGIPNNEPVPQVPDETVAMVDTSPYAEFRITDFDLTDQDGGAVDASIFEGRVTVLNFFFASCPGPCPAMNGEMAALQRATAGTDLQLVSVSVDGIRDTPEVLTNYAAGFEADPQRWRFLTGDPAEVQRIVNESFRFEIRRTAAETVTAVDGTEIANILHPTRLLLVGPDRRLLSAPVDYRDRDGINRLKDVALRAVGNQ